MDDYEDDGLPPPVIPPSPTPRAFVPPDAEPTMMGRLHDAALDFTAPLRYGDSPNEKFRMMAQGEIPGAPNTDPLDPSTERYASNYLGAKKYGAIPASFMNAIALGDIGDLVTGGSVKDIAERKAVGIGGALRGAPETSPMVAAILRRLQEGLRGRI
jgi:hypothetical protein